VRARLRFSWLLWLCSSSGCELVAGLRGDRGAAPHASAGQPEGGGLAEPACTNDGGECAGDAPMLAAGRGGQGDAGGAGGEFAGDAGMSGALLPTAAGDAGQGAAAGAAGEVSDGGFAGVVIEAPLTTPSCAGSTQPGCGSVDPCVTLHVPGGKFQMGRNENGQRADYFPAGASDERPEHDLIVSPYWLDKYEVTVGRFRRFVAAYDDLSLSKDAGANPKRVGSGWNTDWNQLLPRDSAELRARLAAVDHNDTGNASTWTDSPGANECRPINDIDWQLAFAFCIWDDGRLPSEAEWEFAAAGGSLERLFPWGGKAPDPLAVIACSFFGDSSCTAGDLPRVGSRSPAGDGYFGHADLAGSVSEPTRDAYVAYYYARPDTSGTDIINIAFYGGIQQITLRGGDYHSTGSDVRGVSRQTWTVTDESSFVGVRCARDQ
jgi:formylglycine-generating enzyme